jgi:asparagine synthase (glutamine-hydrolysing)
MCGIAGIVSFEDTSLPTAAEILAMCGSLTHRGPDDDGIEISGRVGLGARRLSIIDLQGGRQPIFNEDGTVCAVFNGEIYNYRSLREDLVRRGHRFRTVSDTEVIVHLWEEFGPDFLSRLNGMFAIALHDAAGKRVFLARDHMGIKPLYFFSHGKYLVFGSEIKALLASGRVPRLLDVDALAQFLAWEYAPGTTTLLRGVRKLPAATWMEIRTGTGELRMDRWWRIPEPGDKRPGESLPRTDGEWEEAIDARLRESVRSQMVSDVPLGAFLSGGVDSSLVVAGMGEARTFSIGFRDPSYDELPFARAVAALLRVSHEEAILEPDLRDLFERLMPHLDDPIGDFSVFPTYLVSALARNEVKVVLTGDGGDELFGGYETFVAQQRARLWMRVPGFLRNGLVEPLVRAFPPAPSKKGLVNKAKRFLEGFEHSGAIGHARWRLFAGDALQKALFTEEAYRAVRTPVEEHILRLAEEAGGRDETDRSLYVDARSYLCDNCLAKVDRMSMACSLEARVPFLDPELVGLAFRLPSRFKVRAGRTKPLLKKVAARHVPRRCVERPKEGFSIPMKNWLMTDLAPLVADLLCEERLRGEGLFRPDTVERLKRDHRKGKANNSHILWSLVVFEDWRRRWSV